MTGAEVLLVEPQRQSLWAVAFLAFRTVRQVGLLQLAIFVGFVLARLPSVLVFIALVAFLGLLLFAGAALQWWRYTFMVVGEELVVRRGVVQHQTLSIPLGRVQSVSLEQKLLHRIVSLVRVSLDTAGTDATEFVIDAVDLPVAKALQRAVADYQGSGAKDAESEKPAPRAPEITLLQHGAGRIVKVALTQTPFAGLVVIAPLFAVADDLGRFVPFDLASIDEPTAGWWLAWFVPLLLLGGLAISIILNLVRVLLTDWNLTLFSTTAGLRRDAGLLSTTSVAAPIPRVQMIHIRQGVLERIASLRTVHLDTIGPANLVLPGCTDGQAHDVRRIVLADSDGVIDLDELVSDAEVFRRTRNVGVVAVVVAAAAAFFIGWWSLLCFVPVPYVWFRTRREVRLRRWGISRDAAADRRQFIGWRRHELLVRKVNAVAVSQTLFERKRDLATVTLSTASGSMSIGMIPMSRARELRDEVLFSVETDRRSWM